MHRDTFNEIHLDLFLWDRELWQRYLTRKKFYSFRSTSPATFLLVEHVVLSPFLKLKKSGKENEGGASYVPPIQVELSFHLEAGAVGRMYSSSRLLAMITQYSPSATSLLTDAKSIHILL